VLRIADRSAALIDKRREVQPKPMLGPVGQHLAAIETSTSVRFVADVDELRP
jgi:hypothetical protein